MLGGARKGAVVCCVGKAVKGLYMQRGRDSDYGALLSGTVMGVMAK